MLEEPQGHKIWYDKTVEKCDYPEAVKKTLCPLTHDDWQELSFGLLEELGMEDHQVKFEPFCRTLESGFPAVEMTAKQTFPRWIFSVRPYYEAEKKLIEDHFQLANFATIAAKCDLCEIVSGFLLQGGDCVQGLAVSD